MKTTIIQQCSDILKNVTESPSYHIFDAECLYASIEKTNYFAYEDAPQNDTLVALFAQQIFKNTDKFFLKTEDAARIITQSCRDFLKELNHKGGPLEHISGSMAISMTKSMTKALENMNATEMKSLSKKYYETALSRTPVSLSSEKFSGGYLSFIRRNMQLTASIY